MKDQGMSLWEILKLSNIVVVIVVFALLLGCDKRVPRKAIVLDKRPMMKEPFPYRQTGDTSVVRVLEEGDTVELVDSGYGKDFRYYVVSYKGIHGYLFTGDPLKRLPPNTHD